MATEEPSPAAEFDNGLFHTESNILRSLSDQDVQEFKGDSSSQTDPDLNRHPSRLQRIQSKLSFFNLKLGDERKQLSFRFLKTYLIMAVFILGIFSIYWGSMYGRDGRLKNLRMLVVIEDLSPVDGVQPVIGNAVRELLQTDAAKHYGNWVIWDAAKFRGLAAAHNNTVFEEVRRQIHHQRYWLSIYVPQNASYGLYNAIVTGDTNYNILENTVISYYETGREFLSMNSYVTPGVQAIQGMFLSQQRNIVSELLSSANSTDLLTNPSSIAVLLTSLEWKFEDGIPFTDPVLVAPSQVGLIYQIIITFFAFNMFLEVHMGVAKLGVKKTHLYLYRTLSTILNFFVMSFFFCLVSLAFQVDFSKAFGYSGFLVYWMTNFLTMWAVGALNEAMGMLLVMFFPPLMGFWLLFWVIINISPTFAPIALCAKFYRYGYAMPIHCSFEIIKVIFFDTYKGALGRNYGILVGWVVFSTVLMLVVFGKFGEVMGKRAMLQKQAQRRQFEEELRNENENSVDFRQ